MKMKFKIILNITIGCLFLLIGCQKEESKQFDDSELKLRKNETPLSQLSLNNKDTEDEIINNENIKLCEVWKSLITKEEINEFIVEIAKKNEGNVSYEEIFKKFPEIKNQFHNTILGKRTNTSLITKDGETYDFVHNDIAYNAMLYIPNYSVCQSSNQALLSPEIQIYKEIGEGDLYFAWDLRRGKDLSEVFVNEKEAMQLKAPFVVTSLSHVAFLKPYTLKERKAKEAFRFSAPSNKPKLVERANYDESVWVRQDNILYNYDGGTNAELYVTGAWIADDGNSNGWSRGVSTPQFQASDRNSEVLPNRRTKKARS